MGTYFKILYIGWLGFCLLVFIMYLGMAYQPNFFEGLFGSIVLAIMPYLCFLCIFKIPVDFAVWCDKNNHNINDFIVFFKKYVLYFLIPIIAFMVFIVFNNSALSAGFFCGLPFLWLYVVWIKKFIVFYVAKFWR